MSPELKGSVFETAGENPNLSATPGASPLLEGCSYPALSPSGVARLAGISSELESSIEVVSSFRGRMWLTALSSKIRPSSSFRLT